MFESDYLLLNHCHLYVSYFIFIYHDIIAYLLYCQTYRDIISQVLHANPAAMVISGLTIATLAFNNEILKVTITMFTLNVIQSSVKDSLSYPQ